MVVSTLTVSSPALFNAFSEARIVCRSHTVNADVYRRAGQARCPVTSHSPTATVAVWPVPLLLLLSDWLISKLAKRRRYRSCWGLAQTALTRAALRPLRAGALSSAAAVCSNISSSSGSSGGPHTEWITQSSWRHHGWPHWTRLTDNFRGLVAMITVRHRPSCADIHVTFNWAVTAHTADSLSL